MTKDGTLRLMSTALLPAAICPLTNGPQPQVKVRYADLKNPPITAHLLLFTVHRCLRARLQQLESYTYLYFFQEPQAGKGLIHSPFQII